MNSLNITKEVKQVSFDYTTDNYRFIGNCEVTSDLVVENVNTSVQTIDGTHIGSCSNNGSSSISIYDANHKNEIDVVAVAFKALQDELTAHYSVATFSTEEL